MIMKLSEQLKQNHDCGDFGKALKGYAERAKQLEEIIASSEVSGSCQEPVVMVPYLKNRADFVDGHYCIARLHPRGYHEFWNDKQKEWCSAGSVFELGKAP